MHTPHGKVGHQPQALPRVPAISLPQAPLQRVGGEGTSEGVQTRLA